MDGHFQRFLHRLVHVKVAVGGEATEEVGVGEGGCELGVALVEGGVFWGGDGVVGFVVARRVSAGVFVRDGGVRRFLVQVVLVLHTAREVVVAGEVDLRTGLRELPRQVAELKIQATVRERPKLVAEKLVDRSREEKSVEGNLLLHIRPIRVEAQLNERVLQHPLCHRRVPLGGNRLVRVSEIAVVPSDSYRHAPAHGGVQLLRRQPPLLHRVPGKHLLVDEIRQQMQVFILGLAQLEDGHIRVEPEGGDQLLLDASRHRAREERMQRIEVERHRDFRTVHHCLHPVHERMPLGETAQIVPHLLAVGVKHVRSVLMNGHSRFGIFLIVDIAADVGALVNDEHGLTELGGDTLRHDHAGQAAAYHKVLHVFRLGCTHRQVKSVGVAPTAGRWRGSNGYRYGAAASRG